MGDFWVFGYGSLMWRPGMRPWPVRERDGTIEVQRPQDGTEA